ncbi:helix-turn-helix domain-containing protein [Kitasatospora sp. NPDC051853]|uniref:helix-turn-helix domain-containing protein n=1 Tax=Kitasatospora sp. NPDC051853 TaxID=3364058 RepID=UPI0037883578
MEQARSGAGSIGQRLRELRQKKGLNQQDLASADLSVSYVSLIETGKRAPSEAVLRTLAERVGCSVEYLRTGRDDAKVHELELKIAFGDMAVRNGANGEALQSYSEALASAPFLGETMLRRARIGQALAMEKLGRLEAAIQLLTPLFEDPGTVPGSAEWSQLAVALCRCHRNVGDLTLSVEIGERAMRTLEALGLDVTDDHMQIGSTLISCYHRRGDLTKARLLADRLMGVADETGSRVARGVVYWNAATLAYSQGRHKEALALTERALALLAETDNSRHQAMLKIVYGYLVLENETPDLEHLKTTLEGAHLVLLEVGTATEQARSEALLAQVELRRGEPQQALAHAGRSLGLLRNDSQQEVARARVLLARAQFQSGETAAAQASLESAVRQLEPLPITRVTAQVWRDAGDLWKLLGRPAEALEAYERALTQLGIRAMPAPAEQFVIDRG